jgi:hypothetical protein
VVGARVEADARVEAAVLEASFLGRAISVLFTNELFHNRFLNWCALHAVWVTGKVGNAVADSPVVPGRAVGILRTLARVDALFLVTSQMVGAVGVEEALVLAALVVRVAAVVLLARADGVVRADTALGVVAALQIAARVLALAAVASLSERAFRITLAAGFSTDCGRVANESRDARADSCVAVDTALGVDAARLGRAGIAAVLVETCKVRRAVGIADAFRLGWRIAADERIAGVVLNAVANGTVL